MQVDNWNEDRKERKEEVRILEQLVEDFNTNKLIISSSEEEYERVMKHIDAALRYTGPAAALPPPAVFDSIDKDGSGSLDFDEFLQALRVSGMINYCLNSCLKCYLS